MLRRRNPRPLFAFPAVIAVFRDHVRLPVIETPWYLLVSDVSRIFVCIAYDVLRASLVFFGNTLMAVHFPGLHIPSASLSPPVPG